MILSASDYVALLTEAVQVVAIVFPYVTQLAGNLLRSGVKATAHSTASEGDDYFDLGCAFCRFKATRIVPKYETNSTKGGERW